MQHPTPRAYYIVFGLLLLLLAVTVAAGMVHLGDANFAVAAAIATTKAALILLFFMHVRYSPRLIWLVAGAGFLWMAILIGLTFSDYVTRDRGLPAHDLERAVGAKSLPESQMDVEHGQRLQVSAAGK